MAPRQLTSLATTGLSMPTDSTYVFRHVRREQERRQALESNRLYTGIRFGGLIVMGWLIELLLVALSH